MIEIKNLSYAFEGQNVLDNINLKVNTGDYIAIVGENGAGKTTLLKIILGIIKTKNKVYIDGTEVTKYKEWKNIGYIPQKFQINHDIPISIKEYLNLYTSDKEKLNKLIKKFNLSEILDMNINKLSGGQFQRVNIVKSLCKDINYLILDEPNTGLDKEKRNQLYETLHDLSLEGITVIIITHNLEEIVDKIHKIYDLQTRELKEVDKNVCCYC